MVPAGRLIQMIDNFSLNAFDVIVAIECQTGRLSCCALYSIGVVYCWHGHSVKGLE